MEGPEIVHQVAKGNSVRTIVQCPPSRQMVHFARNYGGKAIVFNLPFPYIIFDIASMKSYNGWSSSVSRYAGTHLPISQSLRYGGLPLPAIRSEGEFCTSYLKSPLPQASLEDSIVSIMGATLQSGHVWNENYVGGLLYETTGSFASLVQLAGLPSYKYSQAYSVWTEAVTVLFPAAYDWWEAQEEFPAEIPLNQQSYNAGLFTAKPIPLLKEE